MAVPAHILKAVFRIRIRIIWPDPVPDPYQEKLIWIRVPKQNRPKPKVLFINFGEKEAAYCTKALLSLRKNNIKSELYPDAAKMKKQMNYANKRAMPYVVIVGSNEIENNNYTLKNMQTGDQQVCSLKELLEITL